MSTFIARNPNRLLFVGGLLVRVRGAGIINGRPVAEVEPDIAEARFAIIANIARHGTLCVCPKAGHDVLTNSMR